MARRNYKPSVSGVKRPSVTEVLSTHLGWKSQALYGYFYKRGKEGLPMNSGRDEAGKLGSCVHDLVSEMLGGEKADYPTELRDKCTPNAVRVVAEIIGRKWMVLNTELAMDAPSYPFVGTTDLVVRDESGATGIADVKTGYVGEEVPIQLAAYAALYENERPADVAPVTWGAAIQCKFGEPINVTIYNHEQIIAAGAIFMALLSIDGLRAKLKAIA